MKLLPGRKLNRKQRKEDPYRPSWHFCLYIAGQTPKSTTAFRNLQRICEEHLAGRYDIEVIDLMTNRQIARDHQIIAVPAVLRKGPLPIRKIIGDLSNTERVLTGLELPAHEPKTG